MKKIQRSHFIFMLLISLLLSCLSLSIFLLAEQKETPQAASFTLNYQYKAFWKNPYGYEGCGKYQNTDGDEFDIDCGYIKWAGYSVSAGGSWTKPSSDYNYTKDTSTNTIIWTYSGLFSECDYRLDFTTKVTNSNFVYDGVDLTYSDYQTWTSFYSTSDDFLIGWGSSYEDRHAYAYFTPKEYTVTYNSGAGKFYDGTTSQKVPTYCYERYSSSFPSDPTPNQSGYRFKGWYTSSSGGTKITDTDTCTSNRTLYAQYESTTYKITYNAGYGSGTSWTEDIYVDSYDYLAYNSNRFTRSGYKFAGWSTSRTSTGNVMYNEGEQIYNLTTSGKTITLYACWVKDNDYVVKFDGNGATGGSMSSQTMTRDVSAYLFRNSFYRTGYDFLGWATYKTTSSSSSAVTYEDGEYVKNLTYAGGTKTLYAVWKVKQYTITFDICNSDYEDFTKEVNYGSSFPYSVSRPYPYRIDGQYFAGYYTSTNGRGTQYYDEDGYRTDEVDDLTVTGNLYLYAYWAPNPYRVCFNANDADFLDGEEIYSYYDRYYYQDMSYNTYHYLTNNRFTRTGYSFLGWSEDRWAETADYSNGARVRNLNDTFNGTVELYAVWKANTYTLTLNHGNGKSNTTYRVVYEEESYPYEIPLPASTSSVTGKHFVGYFTQSNGQGDMIYDIRYSYQQGGLICTLETNDYYPYNQTLYGYWEANTYYIEFDSNGGYYYMSHLTVEYGSYVTLPTNEFKRTGYIFQGWNLDPESTTVKYRDGASVRNLTTEEYAWVTLYAVWKPITYTVKFDNNGGVGSLSSKTMTYDVETELPNCTFTKKFYLLYGWNADASGLGYWYNNMEVVSNLAETQGEVVTLYAMWKDTWINHYAKPSGNGLKNDPFLITKAEELAWISFMIENGSSFTNSNGSVLATPYFKQTNDLYLSKLAWYPIGGCERYTTTSNITISNSSDCFSGYYDGGGYIIHNMKISGITNVGYFHVGLFGKTKNATISNVMITVGNIGGTAKDLANVGSIVGYAYNSTISNCTNLVNVHGEHCAGGIVGLLYNSSVLRCNNYGDVSANNAVGGIAGEYIYGDGSSYNVVDNCFVGGQLRIYESQVSASENETIGAFVGSSNIVNNTSYTKRNYINIYSSVYQGKIILDTNKNLTPFASYRKSPGSRTYEYVNVSGCCAEIVSSSAVINELNFAQKNADCVLVLNDNKMHTITTANLGLWFIMPDGRVAPRSFLWLSAGGKPIESITELDDLGYTKM